MCVYETTLGYDLQIRPADEPATSIRTVHLDQKRPADHGDGAYNERIAGCQPSTQHLGIGPRGVDCFDWCIDDAMQRQVDVPFTRLPCHAAVL